MRKFTIKKYAGKFNAGFYALKKGDDVIAQVEERANVIVLHAIDKRVRFNRREG